MKKWNAVFVAVLSLILIGGNAEAQVRRSPPPTLQIFQSSDCSFLTWMGALCHDTDDGKLYKWDGASLSEIAATTGDGDITDVWACTTGNCNALTAASGDTLDASLANSTIPDKQGTTAELPATCTEGMTYWSSNGDAHYTCTAANTWRLDYNQSLAATANPAFNTINVVGTNSLNLGTAGSAVGQVTFKNATSGGITVQPITGALGTPTLVLGTTFTDSKWCTYATATGFTCNQDGPAGFVDWTADQGATNIHINNIPDLSAVYQPYDADLTTWAGITPSANVQSFLGSANTAAMKAFLSVDDLVTLSGVSDGAVNLGAFTGTTIADNRTIKEALQDMETAFEAASGHTQNTDSGTTGTTFQIDSDNTGPILKNNGGNLEARASGDAAYIGFRALTIQGTTITATTGFSGNLTGNVTGNADTATSATAANTVVVVDSTDASSYIAMFDSATGTMAIKTDAGLTYNASTGVLTATGFSGPLTGNVTGNASGTAASVTGAAQTAITSVGTLTGLTVSGAIVPNAANTIALGSTSAEWADIYLGDGAIIYGQNDQSNTLTSSATGWTAALNLSAAAFVPTSAANAAGEIGYASNAFSFYANSEDLTLTASANTWTVGSGTGVTDISLGAINLTTTGNVTGAAFIGGPGTDTQRRSQFTSNTSFDCASYPDSVYFLNDALMFCNSTASKTPARLEDAQTFTGAKSFTGGLYAGDASTLGAIRIYDGSSNYMAITAQAMSSNYTLTLPADDGTANQVLTTDGSGTLSWASPSATAAGATAGMVQYNASGSGGALAGDAGFIWDATNDKLTLGASGGATTGTLELYYTGTTYAATITPNASMSADVTITLPASSGTLLSAAGSETWTGVQTYSAASNNSTVSVLTFSGAPALNGSDVHRDIYLNHSLGTTTGTTNTVALIDIAAMTGDAETNLYGLRIGNLTGTTGSNSEVEHGINIGTGWDRGISSASPVYVGDGTNGTTIGATGNVSFAGTATFTTAGATSSVPWVVGTGTASNTAEGTAYWESDTNILTIGDGATGISLAFTANTVYTFPSATATLAKVDSQVFTTYIEAPYIILGSAATAADAGTIRMPNAGSIMFEADAAGTDVNALTVDSSEVVQIGSAGASGVTITPATTLTGGIASIGAASNLSGGTVTLGALAGAIDAGGATSFEIPNGASPTVDAAGEIAVDTTSDTLKYYGAAVRVLPYKKTYSVVVPSVADTDDMLFVKLPYGITAVSLDCIVSAATSATINIQECDSAGANCTDMATSDLACDTDGANTTTFNNAVADSGDWLKLDVASISGTPGTLTVTLTYSVNED